MLEMVRSSLGNILKEDPNAESDASTYLLKAVLTGSLRVSKESFFTDVNNFDINTVCSCDMTLSEMIGFTPNEVETLLAYYGLSSRLADVRHWYDLDFPTTLHSSLRICIYFLDFSKNLLHFRVFSFIIECNGCTQ